MNRKLILSNKYTLKAGENKAFIISHQGFGTTPSICIIHPIYAMILTFFDGRNEEIIFQSIASFFHLSKEKVKQNLSLLINNKDFVKNGDSTFPPNLIVNYDSSMQYIYYSVNQFTFNPDKVDLTMSRLQAPVDIICNLTLRCVTSCIYCYADRNGKQSKIMSTNLLNRILQEAKEIGVVRFKLMGGEVLLYPEWESIIKKAVSFGYQPDISTKKPMSEEELIKWKSIKNNSDPIQISLDTLIKSNLYKILHVKDPYYEQIKETFSLMEKHHIDYVVHTVINKFNDSVEDIRSLAVFFKGKRHLKNWMFDAAKCSMYNNLPYIAYKTKVPNLRKIGEYIESLNSRNIFSFQLRKPGALINFNKLTKEEKEKHFCRRNMCSGNLNALYILPDGKVTICEELYWHPKFIIGDLTKQSLLEIWNSKKATELFYLKQSAIPKDSPCSTCLDFSDCRKYKHICWRDTILAYGFDKWYYPDISCPKAPLIEKNISIE